METLLRDFLPTMTTAEKKTPVSLPSSPDPLYATQVFKLPIQYLSKDLHKLNPVVVSDLELSATIDNTMPSIYQCTFSPPSSDTSGVGFAEQIMPMFQTYFTTDISFLTDSQIVIENMDSFYEKDSYEVNSDLIQCQWTAVKHDPKFKETYGYLEWDILDPYNQNATVLQSLTLANMLSPLMSFFLPILFILFPFVLLKIQGIPITLDVYFKILKGIARGHFIGSAISIFESFSFQKLAHVLCMLGLYMFQMYQNTISCLRFYRNVQKINDELCAWKGFRDHSARQIELFLEKNNHLPSYKTFCDELRGHLVVLQDIHYILEPICPFSCSVSKSTEIGYMLKCYYELYKNTQFEKTLVFCMGLEGYLRLMKGVNKQLRSGVVNKTTFISDKDATEISDKDATEISDKDATEISDKDATEISDISGVFHIKQQYYPPHKDEKTCVKNDVTLDTYAVITGPNASGKTTYLKNTAINVILSQQLGIGFYESCTLRPYSHIHSYLNIPDTSSRDSLFQAESRRCKEILELIQTSKEKRHFCIFDELFSGTNPREATKSAYAFLEYLRKYTHVDLFLTTHYVTICDNWKENKDIRPIQNYKMNVVHDESSGKTKPTYVISEGISRVEGALGVLEELNYPEEMIDMITDEKAMCSSADEEIQV